MPLLKSNSQEALYYKLLKYKELHAFGVSYSQIAEELVKLGSSSGYFGFELNPY